MRKLPLLVALFFVSSCLYAQNFNFDSGSFQMPGDESLKDKVILSRDYANVNNSEVSLKLTGNGAFIVFPNVRNLKRISFDYLNHFVSDGQATLIVSYRKGGQEFVQFSSEGRVVVTRMAGQFVQPIFSQHYILADLEDAYDIRFSLETTSSSALYLDNLSFTTFSDKEISDRKAEREYAARMATISSGVYTQNQMKDFNERVGVVKAQFGDNIQGLRDLCYRSRVFAALSGLVGYVNDRTKMGDASQYSIFKQKIEFIKANANDIQKKFLDQLVIDVKPKQFDTVSAPAKQNGLLKFLKVAGDLGNIITGGQFKSVVNSVQGLVSNLFDPSYLKSKTPEVLSYMKGNNVKSKANPDYNFASINEKIKQGIELQSFFFSFFDKIDADTKRFNNVVGDFKMYTEDMQHFVDEVEKLRSDYFKQANFDASDSFYLNIFLVGTDTLGPKMDAFKVLAMRPFESMVIPVVQGKYPTDREIRLKDLENAYDINRRYTALWKEYNKHVIDLRRLFSNMNDDLYQVNPFSKLDTDKKTLIKDEQYGSSYEEYDALQKQARVTFSSVKTNLDVVIR